jgi:endonuclease/exonuclease/phosphatase (EEP) superfamily protein YafD
VNTKTFLSIVPGILVILTAAISLVSFLPIFYRSNSSFFMTVVASGAPLVFIPLIVASVIQIIYANKTLGVIGLVLSIAISVFVLNPVDKAIITKNDNNSDSVSVMTFNTLWNNELPLEDKLKQAKEFSPDVLVLQEVLADDVPLYQSLLGDYPYVEVGEYDVYNIVIFSKIKPFETKHIVSTERIFPVMSFKNGESIVDVVGIHTTSPVNQERYDAWWVEFQDLKEYYSKIKNSDEEPGRSVVMLGDFNATTQHGTMRELISSGLKYVNTHKSWGLPGFPYLMAIDNILVSPQIDVTMFKPGEANGSDHRALLAEFNF